MGKYDDMIHLQRPVSRKHKPMSRIDRAAQFSPFAALTGHDVAIKETARLTTSRPELEEDKKSALDQQYLWLKQNIKNNPEVAITYFKDDARKQGGHICRVVGYLKKINEYERCLVFNDDTRVFMKDVLELEIE